MSKLPESQYKTRKKSRRIPYPPEDEVAAREYEVWRLRTEKGYRQSRIAEKLGINQATVSTILKRLLARFREENKRAVEDYITEQVARYEYIIEEALDAWEKDLKGGNAINNQRDKDYLNVVIKAMEDIRKLIGLIDTKENGPANNADPLARLMAILNAAGTRVGVTIDAGSRNTEPTPS